MADGSFRLYGSVFFLGQDTPGRNRPDRVLAITAKHIIDQIRATAVDHVALRVNAKDGTATWLEIPVQDWFFHPTDPTIDVALLEIDLRNNLDHLVFPLSLCVTEDQLREDEVGLGDEVFITGLFRHHHGTKRNVPIVRVGNIASLAEERIRTKEFGEIDGYLIESRSIGGLSGSPVFLNIGFARLIKGSIRFSAGRHLLYLFGLVHGHYDVASDRIDTNDAPQSDPERLNTGIAIVVPFRSIYAVVTSYLSARGR